MSSNCGEIKWKQRRPSGLNWKCAIWGQKSQPSLRKHCHPLVTSDSVDTRIVQKPLTVRSIVKISKTFKTDWRIWHLQLVEWWRVNDVFQISELAHIHEPSLIIKSPFVWLHLDPGEWSIGRPRLQLEACLGCTRKPPYSSHGRSPRDPCFASLLDLHFFLRFSVRRVQPLETSGRTTALLYVRLHFQSNTHREKYLWKFWIMLPKLHECGNWGHFDLLLFLLRTYGDRHVSSG